MCSITTSSQGKLISQCALFRVALFALLSSIFFTPLRNLNPQALQLQHFLIALVIIDNFWVALPPPTPFLSLSPLLLVWKRKWNILCNLFYSKLRRLNILAVLCRCTRAFRAMANFDGWKQCTAHNVELLYRRIWVAAVMEYLFIELSSK